MTMKKLFKPKISVATREEFDTAMLSLKDKGYSLVTFGNVTIARIPKSNKRALIEPITKKVIFQEIEEVTDEKTKKIISRKWAVTEIVPFDQLNKTTEKE